MPLGQLLSLQQPLCGGEEQALRDLWPLTLCGPVHLTLCAPCTCRRGVCVRCRVSH